MIMNDIVSGIIATGIACLPALSERVPKVAHPLHTLAISISLVFLKVIALKYCPSKMKRKNWYFSYVVAHAIVIPVSIQKIGLPATGMAYFSISLGGLACLAIRLFQLVREDLGTNSKTIKH